MGRSSSLRIVVPALVLMALAAGATLVGRSVAPRATDACPPGYQLDDEAGAELCRPARHPESFAELSRLNGELAAATTSPFATLKPGAYAAAVARRRRMAAQPSGVAGSDGAWTPLGKTPLLASEPGYNEVNASGLGELSGRVNDLAVVPGTSRLYAAVANGGIWRSDDLGARWRPIGDSLPTQVLGAIGWTPAGGPTGTLLALTGDGSFGRYAVSGIGMYRSADDGRTWQRVPGIPDGALGFKVAVDPTSSSVIYAATSMGLFRSADAGRSFADVVLPTGPCAAKAAEPGCFFADVVTDVVVQAPDGFGHRGGRVVAAVGWREGDKKNADGSVQSPRNGIYRSDSGAAGTFQRIVDPAPLLPGHDAPAGFTERHRIGRVEMGAATGPAQNHDYLYAVVQDAVKFEKGFPVIDVPEGFGKNPLPNSDVLNGIFVSPDFGTTWRLMSTPEALKLPITGSALVGTFSTSYAPGIQSWYNQFIVPDPTRQSPKGVPTRLVFGLEEVWQNELTSQPQDGLSAFKVIGRYFGGTTCLGLKPRFPVCPTNVGQLAPSSTTHPDQQSALYVPDGKGGITLVVGNDGGVFTQSAGPGQELTNTRWGVGANRGLQTLLPYHATMAKDGTVWGGLQDNGTFTITPEGRQIMAFGGDGFFTAVDPADSRIAYGEVTMGDVQVTKDGGHTWKDIDPALTSAGFSTPFKMDPHDAKHLIIAGREIKETTSGPDTGSAAQGSTDRNKWKTVYDLGTRTRPGDAAAKATGAGLRGTVKATGGAGARALGAAPGGDPDNRMSAIDLEGDDAYAGFCGFCDTVSDGVPFGRGLATNVGGPKPARRMTGDGWHIAAARGLPARLITSIAIDPADHRSVYVTLAGYERRWAPPGVVGDALDKVGRGHVFRSTDAGESFTDISGDLPDIPVNWVELRKGQLLVGTDLGAFISSDTAGKRYAVLGKGLPDVQVRSIEVAPQDPDLLVVATFGRGVYTYRFPTPPLAKLGD